MKCTEQLIINRAIDELCDLYADQTDGQQFIGGTILSERGESSAIWHLHWLGCQRSSKFPSCDHGNSPGQVERAVAPPRRRGESGSDGVACGVKAGSELGELGAVAAHAVAVAVDLHDGGVVQEPVEDRDGDGGVFEDLTPFGDPAVGGQDHGAVEVAA